MHYTIRGIKGVRMHATCESHLRLTEGRVFDSQGDGYGEEQEWRIGVVCGL